MQKIGLIIISGIILAGCTLGQQQTDVNLTSEPTPTSIPLQAVAPSPVITNQPTQETKKMNTEQAKRAILKTSMGDITVELYADKAPVTVANFAALAEGTVVWIDPKTGKETSNTPYYKNIIFHRIIKDFMVQGGDMTGTGMGGPGYKFKDEFDPSLTFSEPGILAMANSGPATNGSQFFITTVPTPWLNGKHTIFGKVVAGMNVVSAIEGVKTGASDKPVTDVVLKEIIIER